MQTLVLSTDPVGGRAKKMSLTETAYGALRERVFGPHHPEVAGALNNVGIILQRKRAQ